MTDPVRQIADAVLYEGYVLWPYRRSALKNQHRWTFGGVHPPGFGESPELVAQCLLEGGRDARVEVTVRFLQVVRRTVADAGGHPVDALVADGATHVPWDEATEREIAVEAAAVGDLLAGLRVAIDVPAGSRGESLRAGTVTRSWEHLRGEIAVHAEPAGAGVWRIGVRVANTSGWEGRDRAEAMRHSFASTHVVLRARDGAFLSLADPPEHLRAAAEACENRGSWPVLVGPPGERSTVLASPIILEDHPRVAPESPGDLFDGAEIDELLILGVLSLTDEEKREMRASDPRTAAILDRCEGMSPDELRALHGTLRDPRGAW